MCKYKNGTGAGKADPYRLSPNVVPESYTLRLVPDLAAATFSGEVSIKVDVSEPTDEIVLNAVELEIQQATIIKGNGTSFDGTVVLEPDTERARIKVNGTIGTGTWTVKLRFTGILNDKLHGFYRSTYKDNEGVERTIATTQFESTDARRAFPCFDQPDMKATFQVTLVVDPELEAVSNARVVNISHDSGKKVVEFAPTVKMSTYILAFVVGRLVATKPVSVDGVPVRVWCVPGKEHLTSFALETAQFSLRYYKRYFGVSYPGDKLDMLAIPDFAAGAMENLGCVTFREGALLVDPSTAAQSALDWVAEVVAHELAHMWFGDLVTMKWWNGLWLNESFATFMAAKCVDAWKSGWGVWDKFGLSRASAYRTDGLKSTRPVEFVVNSPDDAQGMFDVLTYEKGCSVMRMLEQYLGEDVFQKGIALYIQTHSWSNTETEDLWAAIETASGQPVRQIMNGWILASGYPVVSVERAPQAGSIVLRQQNFKYLSEAADKNQLWMVPVMLRAKTNDGIVEQKLLFSDRESTVYVGEGLDWVVVNAGGHGFYRVVYSGDLRDKLTANVQTTLSVIERVNLVGDAWASVQSGGTTALSFVDLTKLFSGESDPNVWSVVTGGLVALKRLLPKENRPQFEKLVCDLVGPAFAKLGWEAQDGEASQISELRASLFETLALTGNDQSAQSKARELFARWKADRGDIDGNMIASVVNVLAATGDAGVYDEFYALYKGAVEPSERERFMYALSRFREVELLKRTLSYTIDPAEIRTQDGGYVVGRIFGNEVGAQHAWDFAKAHWDKMADMYPDSVMLRMVQQTPSLNTAELEADINAWLTAHPVKAAGKAVAQTLEMLRIAVLLRKRETDALVAAYPAATSAGGDNGTDTSDDETDNGRVGPVIEPHVVNEGGESQRRPDCVGSPEPPASK